MRIFSDVGNQHYFLLLDGVTDNSLANGDVMLEVDVFLKTQGKSMLEFFSGRIHQENAEHLVINQPAKQFGNAFEQFIQVEDGCELTCNLIEQ